METGRKEIKMQNAVGPKVVTSADKFGQQRT